MPPAFPPMCWISATLPKAGNRPEENEDAFAASSAAALRFAIADGATEGWESGRWAAHLANAYVDKPPSPARASLRGLQPLNKGGESHPQPDLLRGMRRSSSRQDRTPPCWASSFALPRKHTPGRGEPSRSEIAACSRSARGALRGYSQFPLPRGSGTTLRSSRVHRPASAPNRSGWPVGVSPRICFCSRRMRSPRILSGSPPPMPGPRFSLRFGRAYASEIRSRS